ncbi:MAG: hypothetical protein HN509_02425 [Halobacteriovoraceae bacterium]|jgi:3-hydroxybutyryl-CoA dehydrogenase|nr:hypothetical protein [Halobacteriovoraceae bacterium]MBT5095428.1 hypothetical protein [Halobacteriovoraceae bacterium]
MNNRHWITILTTRDYPFFEALSKLQQKGVKVFNLSEEDPFEQKNSHYLKSDFVFDLTMADREKKLTFLKHLDLIVECPIISDLSLHWGELFFDNIPHLKGAISCVFPSPTDTYESYSSEEGIQEIIGTFLGWIGKKTIPVSQPGIGFIYPRVLSNIINEAYFAKEELLATEEAIDRAMKFGVNYPLGPFEWAKQIGAKNIVSLLDELFFETKDPRYRVSPLLRLESQGS